MRGSPALERLSLERALPPWSLSQLIAFLGAASASGFAAGRFPAPRRVISQRVLSTGDPRPAQRESVRASGSFGVSDQIARLSLGWAIARPPLLPDQPAGRPCLAAPSPSRSGSWTQLEHRAGRACRSSARACYPVYMACGRAPRPRLEAACWLIWVNVPAARACRTGRSLFPRCLPGAGSGSLPSLPGWSLAAGATLARAR
jgi:hypothetical protein